MNCNLKLSLHWLCMSMSRQLLLHYDIILHITMIRTQTLNLLLLARQSITFLWAKLHKITARRWWNSLIAITIQRDRAVNVGLELFDGFLQSAKIWMPVYSYYQHTLTSSVWGTGIFWISSINCCDGFTWKSQGIGGRPLYGPSTVPPKNGTSVRHVVLPSQNVSRVYCKQKIYI